MRWRSSERRAAELLVTLPHWRHETARDAISREFVFADFTQAFAFMTQIALFAETHDHHPEWSDVYNRVVITLTTHDASGLTQRDIDLARYAEQAFARFAKTSRPAMMAFAEASKHGLAAGEALPGRRVES